MVSDLDDYERSASELQQNTMANSKVDHGDNELSDDEEMDSAMDGEMSGFDDEEGGDHERVGRKKKSKKGQNTTNTEIELQDNRPKKQTGLELCQSLFKELHEVIAYMDYSFERAFTIQEKEYMLAYKVSIFT